MHHNGKCSPINPTWAAAANGCAEDVGVAAVVISELKLRDVQRHIFGADLVERADNAALEDRPETLNRVGVDRADHVLAFGVIDSPAEIPFSVFRIRSSHPSPAG